MADSISTYEDILDVRDIIERYEELEEDEERDEEDEKEFKLLESLLEELKGMGGDEQWKGDWYPITLIRDSYFKDYTEELCKDVGYISSDFPSWIEVDWEATADNVQQDYSSIEIEGVEYWYR